MIQAIQLPEEIWTENTLYKKGSIYFAVSNKSSAGAILPFKTYPALSTYNTSL